MSKTTETSASDGRRPNGRFAPGNRASKGNKLAQRMGQLRQLVETAITDADITAVVASLVTFAKMGDTQAAALLLAYAIGRPRTAPLRAELDLPPLTDAAAVAEALRGIVAATAAGDIDLEAAQGVAALVTTAATATHWADLEARVRQLEQR